MKLLSGEWQNTFDDKSILVQVSLVPSGTSHYLSQCWRTSVSPYMASLGHNELCVTDMTFYLSHAYKPIQQAHIGPRFMFSTTKSYIITTRISCIQGLVQNYRMPTGSEKTCDSFALCMYILMHNCTYTSNTSINPVWILSRLCFFNVYKYINYNAWIEPYS